MWAHFRNIGHEIDKKANADEKNVAMNETLVDVEPPLFGLFFAHLIRSCLCREFSRALGFEPGSYMLGRFFKIFDQNSDGKINFVEFLKALSFLCDKATTAEKIKCKCWCRS